MATVKAIVAISLNGVIGKNGTLPWHLPGELKWFKKITLGHIIVMGRKTWESLPGALPGRENWVLSRSINSSQNPNFFTSFDLILKQARERTVFIIGGGEIYSAYLGICEELYLTEVQQKVDGGDAFFPPYKDRFECVETLEENHEFIIRKWQKNNCNVS